MWTLRTAFVSAAMLAATLLTSGIAEAGFRGP